MGWWRVVFLLIPYALMTAILMPVQAAAIVVWPSLARWMPVFVHRITLKVLGVRLRVIGAVSPQRPLLLASNHSSWIDIAILSALAPVSFVAKSEIAGWPIFGLLAKLQRSVFIERVRTKTAGATTALAKRLASGDIIVLFAEGTTNLGNTVLPFRSSMFAAVGAGLKEQGGVVQPVAIVYTKLDGLPIGRADRPHFAWTGDDDLPPHLLGVVRRGHLDVTVAFGEPIPACSDRKALSATAERAVRRLIAEQRESAFAVRV